MYSQHNLEQLFQLIGTLPGQVCGSKAHYEFIKTTSSVWPNQLFNLDASGDKIDRVLDQIEQDARTGSIPGLLMLRPEQDGTEIYPQLQQRGYKSSVWTAMSHNLQRRQEPQSIDGFQIQSVEENDEVQHWLRLVESELMGSARLNAVTFQSLAAHPDCYFYLGCFNAKPVATALLFVSNSTAGIYLVSTASDSRRRGFGKAITQHCLLQAKALACDRVDIQATGLGQSVYQSLGFVAHGAINVFRIG